jgi:hypothetical protein
MSDSCEISFEKGEALEKWALAHAKKNCNNPNPNFFRDYDSSQILRMPPRLERTSRDGSRQDFLNRSLEILLSYNDNKPRVIGKFFSGWVSHITFISANGKIFSWYENIDGADTNSLEFFTYDYDYLKSRINIIREDLCKSVFHPKNQGKLWFIDEEVY